MSEQRDSEARGDDPLTCSKCGGPTKENGRWHPDIGAVYGYELGLAERDPASDTPEVVERPETCPTCGSDDPRIRYEECDDGSWEPPGPFANVNPCLDPFHTPGDTEEAPSRVEEDDPLTEGQRGGIAALRYYEHWKKREEARAPASPQPVASEEDREVIRHLLRDGGNGVPLTAAGPLIRILTDSEALAQYAKERGE